LRSAGFERYGICGEVFLWGKVVEHERGWRAQLAYPKNLFLSPDALPFTLAEIRSRLQALTLYGSDIFVLANGETISLWANDSGYSPAGLDYLIEMSKRYYDRRRLERTLKTGDRVAVLGLGIAVVEHVDGKEVHAVLWSKNVVRIGHKEIVWDEANMRWEANHSSVSQTKPKAMSLACTQVRQKGWRMDYINNKDEKIGSLTVAVSNDKSVTINRLNDVTTVIVRDRNTGKVSSETFIGDSPFGK
jgi:hypothetical protein